MELPDDRLAPEVPDARRRVRLPLDVDEPELLACGMRILPLTDTWLLAHYSCPAGRPR